MFAAGTKPEVAGKTNWFLALCLVAISLSVTVSQEVSASRESPRPSASRAPSAQQPSLAKLVADADRIVVATVPEGFAANRARSVQTIKGDHSPGVSLAFTLSKTDTVLPPQPEKKWVLFLHQSGHRRQVPALFPVHPTAWFMPYSEQLGQEIKQVLPSPAHWGEPVNGLRMGLRLRKQRFDLGELIPLEIHIRNQGRVPLTIFQHRYNIYDYFPFTSFEVTGPDGKHITVGKPEGPIEEDDAPHPRKLEPGETYIRTVHINLWPPKENGPAPFTSLGRHTVRCIYACPYATTENRWFGILTSSDIELRIVPPATGEAHITAQRNALARNAIALAIRHGGGTGQSTTGLDLSQMLYVTGQTEDLRDFTEDHRLYQRDIEKLTRLKKTWALCALLDHPNVDAKILAARALAQLADPNTTPVLLAGAKSNNYWVQGSESATLHNTYRQTLKQALEKTTGLSLTPGGLTVTVYPKPSQPKVIRSDDDPSYFKEHVAFWKVENWLRQNLLCEP
ncbi:MAG TPA: hypothetical protein VMW16_00070 [Sedimentisphaerales bacterium]|nr:hypothetical protein [Sedimentisphaerales bacterium]